MISSQLLRFTQNKLAFLFVPSTWTEHTRNENFLFCKTYLNEKKKKRRPRCRVNGENSLSSQNIGQSLSVGMHHILISISFYDYWPLTMWGNFSPRTIICVWVYGIFRKQKKKNISKINTPKTDANRTIHIEEERKKKKKKNYERRSDEIIDVNKQTQKKWSACIIWCVFFFYFIIFRVWRISILLTVFTVFLCFFLLCLNAWYAKKLETRGVFMSYELRQIESNQ